MRQLKNLLPSLAGMHEASDHVVALQFLLDVTAADTWAQPPAGVSADRILQASDEDLPRVLDDCCERCLAAWPEQLDGFFDRVCFSDQPAYMARAALQGVSKIPWASYGPGGRATRLADLYQHGRALSSKQWQGAFFTPWNLARAMAMIQEPNPGEWIVDPACGGAVFLIAALEVVRENHGPVVAESVTLIGVDIDRRTCQIARASLLIAGANPHQFWIFGGNALAQPICGRDRADDELKTINFSLILANPPFGSKTASAQLAADADDGPLIIPREVLYREIWEPIAPTAEQAA